MQANVSHENNFNLIRLVAALQVLLVHSVNHFEVKLPYVDALKVAPGVPAFFFISGLLIYQSFDRMRERGTTSFFINRVLRIYPALWVCVAVSTLSVFLTGYFAHLGDVSPRGFTAWILSQATFLQFYNPDFMRGYGVGVLNGALWTISVELQFYVLVPFLYLLLRKHRWLAASVFLVSLAANIMFREYSDGGSLYMKLLYVSFVPWVYMFMFGAIVASTNWLQNVLPRVNVLYILVLYVLSMNFVGSYGVNASNAINPVSFVLLGLLILKIARIRLPLPGRLVRFIRRNDFSYGLYLYHMPVINLLLVIGLLTTVADVAMTLAASVLAASMSWYLIERPALNHKRRVVPQSTCPT